MSNDKPVASYFHREESFKPEQSLPLPIIPLVKPFLIGNELEYIAQTVKLGNIAGDGAFSEKCCRLLRERFNIREALLVSSGATALDLAAALCNLRPGDEVILPSYTFVATANAFLRYGAKLIFADVRPDTMNIDETTLESKLTDRTKVIVPVHYAGVGCEMDVICSFATKHNLILVEDAAQGVDAYYKGRPLGTFGEFSIYSFHEAKNHTAGQAGAVCLNEPSYVERAEILRDKGTNRRQFFRGEASKYEWVDLGVGHALSEINAAYLFAQLEKMGEIAKRREEINHFYRDALRPLEDEKLITIGKIPSYCHSNYHILWFLLRDESLRNEFIAYMRRAGIATPFHYTPLHTSPMGQRMGYSAGDLPVTEDCSARLVRLPFYHDLSQSDLIRIMREIYKFFGRTLPSHIGN
jgi:dTDP-4-amino-4,6-dideoxygalactose transaminase